MAQTNVLTQHNDLKRTGWNSNESQLTQAAISGGNFGKIFTIPLDDQVYAQPLIVSNASIAGGTHNIVIVATVNNTIYAFDADNLAGAYWQQNLTYNPATYRPIRNADMTGACGGNYKDFSGNMGIVGTPVIDTTTNTIYVVSRSVTKTGTPVFVQYLHALDITTGAEKPNSPVYITATYPGNGDGSSGGIITFNQQTQNQRPGLLLFNGVVYLAWASHCDWGPYHGWVMGYDAATLQQKYVYNNTPDGGYGGIWMSGQAPAVDDNGYIYITTGNGTTGNNGNVNDTLDRSESVLKLSVASGKLKVVDFFTPFDYDYLNTNDLDYGVDGVLLIPNTNLSLSGSKESYLYLLDNTKMGGTTSNNSNVLQQLNVNASSTDYNKHLHGSPVYFMDNNSNEYVYAWAEGGLLKQFPFKRTTMLFDTLNKKVGNTALPPGMPGAMLALSSSASQQGTGILWSSHPIYGDANQSVVPGILQAFDATDITHELWNSNWSSKRDAIGKFAKYSSPTIANGKVYMATFSNSLNVYGLNPPAVSACSATLPSPWQSADIGYVTYPGDVCYDNGVFTITASGDDLGGTADAFHHVYQPAASNNVEITARIVSVQNTSPAAKCGVMFRANLDAGSPNAFMGIAALNGSVFQKRIFQSNGTTNKTNGLINVPYWVKLVSNGNKYVGYISANGTNWTAVDSVTVALGAHPYVGLAYTDHDNSNTGTAVVDNVSVIATNPVAGQLQNFTGTNITNTYAKLDWETTSELNIDHFDIERSSDTTNFTKIGAVQSLGNSSAIQQYTFNDVQPLGGKNYYRLKQVNVDGSIAYSTVVMVVFNFALVDIYPNPAHGFVYISNNSVFTNDEKIQIQLSDALGQIILQQTYETAGQSLITVDLSPKIATGVYVLKVINSKGAKQARKIYIRQ